MIKVKSISTHPFVGAEKSFSTTKKIYNRKKKLEGEIMNLEIITQLAVLTLVVISGPLVIALLVARRGNL